MNSLLKNWLLCAMGIGLLTLSFDTRAMPAVHDEPQALVLTGGQTGLVTTQRGGMSLAEAVDSVRHRAEVERVISAETKVSGGREVHQIRVMTKDGKVKTYKVPGQRRNQ